ncbi:hypothetical protein KIN20_015868 [Parelaphostrongylus tenuis]|uniref:Uncharacterized protein n=1 Tax=Parelaphostrongylus tenuis TaxID=148309 RepID=A0AAD5MFL1_PARTN|nr:hypothetical protein KIN20_015868 [Parelaphostrongylus tenuis]
MNLMATLALLFITALIAILPGFPMAAYCKSFIPVAPSHISPTLCVSYVAKVTGAFVLYLASTILYADLVFPLVMFSYAQILKRYSKHTNQLSAN